MLILQLFTVAIVYVVGSALPALPAVFAQIEEGRQGDPDLSSPVMASTVVVGMGLALLLCWAWLRRENRVGHAWTLMTPGDGWPKTLLWAVIGTVVIFGIFAGGGTLLEALGFEAPDPGFVLGLVTESPLTLTIWIVGVAWLAAGLGEELLFRGFIMDRLSLVAGIRGRIWIAVVIQALLFGLPHAYQGWGGMIVTSTVGLFLGWLRLRMNGNLWACVLAHAAVDTISMSVAYATAHGLIG